jgi:protein-S-isoprenylcysteine O-methyltransferase Ste14
MGAMTAVTASWMLSGGPLDQSFRTAVCRRQAYDRPEEATMRTALLAVGIALFLFGLLFTLQGFGAVQGSPMSNTTTWSVLGPIIAAAGLVLAVVNRPRH